MLCSFRLLLYQFPIFISFLKCNNAIFQVVLRLLYLAHCTISGNYVRLCLLFSWNVPGLYQVRRVYLQHYSGDVKWPSGSQQQKTVGFQSLEAGGLFRDFSLSPHVCAGVRELWNFVSPLSLNCFDPLCLPPCFPLCLPLCLPHCVSHCVCHLVSQFVFHLVSHLVFPLCPPLCFPPCVPLCLPLVFVTHFVAHCLLVNNLPKL